MLKNGILCWQSNKGFLDVRAEKGIGILGSYD